MSLKNSLAKIVLSTMVGLASLGTSVGAENSSRVPTDYKNNETKTSQYKGESNCYFLFSNKIQGTFFGEAYRVEPHGQRFKKDYTINSDVPYILISKIKAKEFEGICKIEDIGKPLERILDGKEEVKIKDGDVEWVFPAGCVDRRVHLVITKVKFNANKEKSYLEDEIIERSEYAGVGVAAGLFLGLTGSLLGSRLIKRRRDRKP